jgi:uncharacterized protein (TIRG00374 family)
VGETSLRGVARATIGLAISIIALLISLRGVDLGQAFDIATSAAPTWFAAMLGFTVLDIATRSLRWQRLVRPVAAVRYLHMAAYLTVGYLANNVLPARLGELVRSHYLGEREGISRTTTLGTVVVERVIDLTIVVLIAAGAILILAVRGVVVSAVAIGLAVAGLMVLGLVAALVAHRIPGADRVAAVLSRWPLLTRLGARLRDGLAVAGRPRTLGEAIGLSLVAWSFSTLVFAAAGQSIGVELAIGQAALMASGTALATAIPSGPGYFGTFELAGVQIAQSFGIDADSAFALTLLAHASVLVVTSLSGAVSLIWLTRGSGRRSRPADDGAEAG